MNLNRYKVKLPSQDAGARPLEFVGSWIMFGGGILFTWFLSTGVYRDNEQLHILVYVIGSLYTISWFSARNRWILLAFALLSFTVPLVVIQLSITTITYCASAKLPLQCSGSESMIIVIYSIYIFSVFLGLLINLIKRSRLES